MIPLKLTVKNFMCYRDNAPSLSLESVHVACLCGENGHGKSALLDAITWVLWGQSRARTQEELVHLGQQDMAVDLEFRARGQRYRVSRRYTRTGQGKTLLELQVVDGNSLTPITSNTVRETEVQIRNILHMDYNTFVNTAFLLQGQADMFTRSSPSDRKEVLAEVLDLSYYQALESRAKEHTNSAQDKSRGAESVIVSRQEEKGKDQEISAQLASLKSALTTITQELDSLNRQRRGLQKSSELLAESKNELAAIGSRLEAGLTELTSMANQERLIKERCKNYESSLEREALIRHGSLELERARADVERLGVALIRKGELDVAKAQIEKEIALRRQHLSATAGQLNQRIVEDLEPLAAQIPWVQKELQAASAEQGQLKEASRLLQQKGGESDGVLARMRHLQESNEALLKGMEEDRKKFDMLQENEALCPLCNHPLDTSGRKHLRLEYESRGKKSKLTYKEQSRECEALDSKHAHLIEEYKKQESDLGQRQEQSQAKILSQKHLLKNAKGALEELGPSKAELKLLRATLDKKSFALEEHRELERLDTDIASLNYDGTEHALAQRLVKENEHFAELSHELAEAQEKLPAEKDSLANVRQVLQGRQKEIEDEERRRMELEQEVQSLPQLESELRHVNSALNELEAEQQQALVKQGMLHEQLNRAKETEALLARLTKERSALEKEAGFYNELAVAFGKDGIQALIIEAAIPQLQDDANELLARLTDGRLTLKIQLQEGRRERRMGLPSEEIDIRIGDEVGTRSYETFSGGEAFRINFALRIALSRLLARRSGAPLPILFIDEGFGSQDVAGQERLKEAIQSIQGDFEKIIVITHVEEIKEAFPTRIEVTKTDKGSTFSVV